MCVQARFGNLRLAAVRCTDRQHQLQRFSVRRILLQLVEPDF
jgi:hypothetical protein